jgi:MraZ protein
MSSHVSRPIQTIDLIRAGRGGGRRGPSDHMGVAAHPPFISMPVGTLDKKGRVCIPAIYRQILAAQSTSGVYVCPSFSEPTLECFGETVLQEFHQAQAHEDPFFTEVHDVKTFSVLAMTQLLAIDETGRVRLPDSFIAHAGLSENVTFIGMGRKFEIWDTESFAPVLGERLASAKAIRKSSRADAS